VIFLFDVPADPLDQRKDFTHGYMVYRDGLIIPKDRQPNKFSGIDTYYYSVRIPHRKVEKPLYQV